MAPSRRVRFLLLTFFWYYIFLCLRPFSFRLLGDPDEDVQEQAFNAVRNLTESEDGIAMVFREIGIQVLGRITTGLSSRNDNVVLQVFFFLLYIYIFFTEQYPRRPLRLPTCPMEQTNNKNWFSPTPISSPLSKFVFQKPKQKFEVQQYLASLNWWLETLGGRSRWWKLGLWIRLNGYVSGLVVLMGMEGLVGVGVAQFSSVRVRRGEVLEGIRGMAEVAVAGLGVGEGVGRCVICMDQGIRLLGLMRIEWLLKERELLWIGWNMEKDMFDWCLLFFVWNLMSSSLPLIIMSFFFLSSIG